MTLHLRLHVLFHIHVKFILGDRVYKIKNLIRMLECNLLFHSFFTSPLNIYAKFNCFYIFRIFSSIFPKEIICNFRPHIIIFSKVKRWILYKVLFKCIYRISNAPVDALFAAVRPLHHLEYSAHVFYLNNCQFRNLIQFQFRVGKQFFDSFYL